MRGTGALLLLTGVLAGAVFGYRVFRPVSRAERSSPPPVNPAPLAVEDWQELADRMQRLEARVSSLELRPVEPARTPLAEFVPRDEFEALRAELAEAPLAQAPPPRIDGQLFQREVETALSAIRRNEAVEGLKKAQNARAERLEQDLEHYAQELSLSAGQVSDLRRALLDQYGREEELRILWEQGSDPEFVGERKRSYAALFEADLGSFLSDEQRERFWTVPKAVNRK